MGGSNPYIEEVKYTPATKKFKVTFLPSGKTIEVDPAKIPYGHNGIPGSILDISEGIKAGLDHACGGVCACSTCHVIVRQGSSPATKPPTRSSTSSTRPPASRRNRVWAAKPFPTAPLTSSWKFPIGTRTTPKKPTTEVVKSDLRLANRDKVSRIYL